MDVMWLVAAMFAVITGLLGYIHTNSRNDHKRLRAQVTQMSQYQHHTVASLFKLLSGLHPEHAPMITQALQDLMNKRAQLHEENVPKVL